MRTLRQVIFHPIDSESELIAASFEELIEEDGGWEVRGNWYCPSESNYGEIIRNWVMRGELPEWVEE